MPSPLATPWSRREYMVAPEPVTGWELDPERGWFSAIVPEQTITTNLITNPSFETVTTGWSNAVGTSIARSSAYQRRGAYSLSITPTGGVALAYYSTLSTSSATWYAFSLDLRGTPGSVYRIYFATTAGAQLGGYTEVRGKDYWERIHVLYYETTGASRRVYVEQVSGQSGAFYIDGAQVEANNYTTTYFDGDTVPLVPFTQSYYSWSGAAHGSVSIRLANTPGGGREVNLLDIGFRVVAAIGLGMMPVRNITTPISTGGALYQRALPAEREFALAGSVWGETEAEVQAIRRELVSLFSPLGVPQPVTLRYHQYSDCGQSESDIANIPCVYQSGLEQNMDDTTQERIGIIFKSYLPYVLKEGDTGVSANYQYDVLDADYMLMRDSDGVWGDVGGGAAGGGVKCFAQAPDGSIYVGGNFTSMGGVANTYGIAKWNGASWASVGGGLAAGESIYAMEINPADGVLYVGGSFVNLAGITNADYIAKWNGSAWSALGTGANLAVNALELLPGGLLLYAGGAFTSMGGVANTSQIAKWNGTAWSEVGGGIGSGEVTALKYDPASGFLYIGGGNIMKDSSSGIFYWDGSAYHGMGSGVYHSVAYWVYGIAIDASSNVYVGGIFTSAGGVTVSNIAKWNGTSWSGLGEGISGSMGGVNVWALEIDPISGYLYAGGLFDTAGTAELPDSMAQWNGASWSPMDVDLPGSAAVYVIYASVDRNLYVGFNTSGTAYVSGTNTLLTGTVTAYPAFIFGGPGTIYYIKNITTGKSLYFSNLNLSVGERAILTISPGRCDFRSNLRPNLMSYILPSSNLDFSLRPGSNNVVIFMAGATVGGTTYVSINWSSQYASLDHTVRRFA